MKRGDLVVLQGKLCATSFSGRLGFIVGVGQPAPGWQVFWIHIPGRGTFSFEPSDLQELP
jgi:hypothetical protein